MLAAGCGGGAPTTSGTDDPTRVADLQELLGRTGEAPVVLLFTAVDCPISNTFAPEAERIHREYAEKGVAFYLVYWDPDSEDEAIREHLASYGYTMPYLVDDRRVLIEHTGATVTPEAVVLSAEGEVLYRGRIDDTYVDFGKQRAAPTRRDLRLALDAILDGQKPEVDRTRAVGCYIADA